MAKVTYDPQLTALLVVDPYNDFISEGGKVWNRIKGVADANNCVPNMLQVLNAARNSGLRIFYALHHRYRPGEIGRPASIRVPSNSSVAAKKQG
jgi:ureidoacrylate peracid hydrolase